MTVPLTLAVGGPTASGKTALAVALAMAIGGELVNADSRQAMRRLRAGTAAPTAEELRGVPCHLLDETEPGEPLSVADWLHRAREVIATLDARTVPAILVGGTGQYLRALRQGWVVDGGPPDPAQRAQLTATATRAGGLAELVLELRQRDPAAAASIDTANPRRVIRALELLRGGASSVAGVRRRGPGRHIALIVLDAERPLHQQTVRDRVRAMFDSGRLLAEVRAELAAGTSCEALVRAGIGYREGLDVVNGVIEESAARELTVTRTLRYAKAQRTWFRAEPAVLRLQRDRDTKVRTMVAQVLAAALPGAPTPTR